MVGRDNADSAVIMEMPVLMVMEAKPDANDKKEGG